MTRIDFYILGRGGISEALLYACQLAEKAFHKGHRVYLHADNALQAAELDKLLWSFSPASFLPHSVLTANNEAAPIAVGYGDSPGDHSDVMINLSAGMPDFFSRFQRLGEVICQDPHLLAAGRQRYKFYKDRGYPLHKHDIGR